MTGFLTIQSLMQTLECPFRLAVGLSADFACVGSVMDQQPVQSLPKHFSSGINSKSSAALSSTLHVQSIRKGRENVNKVLFFLTICSDVVHRLT